MAADGDALALRGADGTLSVLGRRRLFAAEQWLSAAADDRDPRAAIDRSACDRSGGVGILPDGRAVSLIFDRTAFAEDCLRADIVVTPFYAPPGCAAALVLDRGKLKETGAEAALGQGAAHRRGNRCER